MKKGTIVLGGDPGSINFGLCILKTPNTVLFSGTLYSPINDLKNPNYSEYTKNVMALLNRYRPTTIVLERFLARGYRGNGGEKVTSNTMMLAQLAYIKFGIKPILVMPATWKTALSREGVDIENLYSFGNQYGISHHRIDSLLMAQWVSNDKPHFKFVCNKLIKSLADK